MKGDGRRATTVWGFTLSVRVVAMASGFTSELRFLHTPKTGGSWAYAAMLAAGIRLQHPAQPANLSPRARHYADAGHPGLAEIEGPDGLFTFAFVRHPLAWWRSFWGHRMREGWILSGP